MHFQRHKTETRGSPVAELLWTLSPQAVFSSLSLQVSQVTGWSDTDLLGQPFQAFLHPNDVPRIQDRYKDILAGETITLEEVRCLDRSGSFLTWALSLMPRIERGAVLEIVVFGHLTESAPKGPSESSHAPTVIGLHSEKERSPSAATVEYAGLAKLLEGMLGNAPIGFALFDDDLRFICLNQSFSEMTGFSPAQQLGQSLRELIPKVANAVDPVMRNVLSTGKSVIDYEVKLQRAAIGEIVKYAQMSFYPIPTTYGGFCGVAAIAVDITERKRLDAILKKTSEELARSNLALEEFSYIASHDLREPLRTMSCFVSLLKEKHQGKFDQEAEEYLTFVADGATRSQRLIDKLLEYSKAGKVERGFFDVDCNTIVQTIIGNLKVCLEESRGTVTYDPLPTVRGDELLLLQIFQNLVANALKYKGSAPPNIHVTAKRELRTWVFSVVDNGIGISSDNFSDVFRPFRKLHSQSEYAGSGLGLAICQKNVERHGGQIWVSSVEGKGSTFSFTVPASRIKGSDPA